MWETDDAIDQNPRGLIPQLPREDAKHVIDRQLSTANYLLPPASGKKVRDYLFYDNNSVWEAVLMERNRAYSIVTLNSFFLFEWIPLSPGLYYTEDGRRARKNARKFITGIEDGAIVYSPHGKGFMIRGGVGNIRIQPREVEGTPLWFMSASSGGTCHEGFPVALPQDLYDEVIDEIQERGAVVRTITGKLKFIPKNLVNLYGGYREVPQLYLLADSIRKPEIEKSRRMAELKVSVAVSFVSEYEGREGVYASYVHFDPGDKESVTGHIKWMEEIYVKTRYKGQIVTDFDEQMSRFSDATFSLSKVMGGKLDRAEVERTIQTIHIYTRNVDGLFANIDQLNVRRLEVTKTINFGDNANVSGQVFIADDIVDSFNRVSNSQLDENIKALLEDLAKKVSAVGNEGADQNEVEGLKRDVKSLNEEITSPKPRKGALMRYLEGIKDGAVTIGAIAAPIVETANSLKPYIEGVFK